MVFDPALTSRQAELRDACRGQGIESVLDTRVMELALPGSADRAGLARVPWATTGRLPAAALTGESAAELATAIVDYVARNRLGAVLAPTHFRGRRGRVTGEQRPRSLPERGEIDKASLGARVCAKRDVLRHTEVRHEIELLIDHLDAARDGIGRAAEIDLFAGPRLGLRDMEG